MSIWRDSRNDDIKAPDGYLLGGLRLVRRDGSVLFHRMWWRCPKEWVGERIWVHVDDDMGLDTISAAPPGQHIYRAQSDGEAQTLYPVERPDAKPGFRRAAHKAWAGRAVA